MTEIKQYFTSYRSPGWDAPVETVPQEAETQPEVQPIGWVINSSANVFIDEEGLHVFDGAIFLNDYSGESVLNASGFSGSWVTYLFDGLYNSRFEYGDTGNLFFNDSAMSQMPYWFFAGRTHPEITAERLADADTPGGHAVRINANDASNVSTDFTRGQIAALDIPVQGGRDVILRVLWRAEGHDATKPVTISGVTTWYDENDVVLSSLAVYSTERAAPSSSGVYEWTVVGHATAPQEASYVRLWVGPAWHDGANLNSFAEIAEVQFLQANNDYDEIYIGTGVFDNFHGSTRLRDPGKNVSLRIEPEAAYLGELLVLKDGDSFGRASIGTEGIGLGSGSVAPDVYLRRTGAGELELEGTLERYLGGWVAPTLLNSWTQYSNYTVGYMKDAIGFVHLRGMVEGGTPPSTVFVLPVGFRPGNANSIFVNNRSGGTGRIDVGSNGDVDIVSGVISWNSLDGISFKAEN